MHVGGGGLPAHPVRLSQDERPAAAVVQLLVQPEVHGGLLGRQALLHPRHPVVEGAVRAQHSRGAAKRDQRWSKRLAATLH